MPLAEKLSLALLITRVVGWGQGLGWSGEGRQREGERVDILTLGSGPVRDHKGGGQVGRWCVVEGAAQGVGWEMGELQRGDDHSI